MFIGVKIKWRFYIVNFNSCYKNFASKINRILSYYKLRLARLPDSNYAISSGFACGAMVSFTPLLGFHFIIAVIFAYMIRGNFIASLLGFISLIYYKIVIIVDSIKLIFPIMALSFLVGIVLPTLLALVISIILLVIYYVIAVTLSPVFAAPTAPNFPSTKPLEVLLSCLI